jgi:hypothetical protein
MATLGVFIAGLSVYLDHRQPQNSEENNSNIVVFLRSWDPLLDTLRFSKRVHDDFQDFEREFSRFLESSADNDSEKSRRLNWGTVSSKYEEKLSGTIRDCPPISEVDRDNWNEVKLPIREKVKNVSRIFPALIDSLRNFEELYQDQANSVSNRIYTSFDTKNDSINDSVKVIMDRADKLILNLVDILIYNYSLVTQSNF